MNIEMVFVSHSAILVTSGALVIVVVVLLVGAIFGGETTEVFSQLCLCVSLLLFFLCVRRACEISAQEIIVSSYLCVVVFLTSWSGKP